MTPGMLAAAETLNLCLPPSPGVERVVEARFAAFIGPTPEPQRNLVQRLRLADADVEPVVAEIRALFRSRDRRAVTWEIGPSSTPTDLVPRLRALGMVPDEEPVVAGMVLAKDLPAMTSDVVVKPVVDRDGLRAHMTILRRGFAPGAPDPTEDEVTVEMERQRAREAYLRHYLAFVDGKPVAGGEAWFLDGAVVLGGGATLPEARGKGAYRALVAARFRDAVARGTPALVVQAGAMSRPILEKLGFETVATIHVLLDRFE